MPTPVPAVVNRPAPVTPTPGSVPALPQRYGTPAVNLTSVQRNPPPSAYPQNSRAQANVELYNRMRQSMPGQPAPSQVPTGVKPSVVNSVPVGVKPSVTSGAPVGVPPSITTGAPVGVRPSVTSGMPYGARPSIVPPSTGYTSGRPTGPVNSRSGPGSSGYGAGGRGGQ
jgi:hypothetical protein